MTQEKNLSCFRTHTIFNYDQFKSNEFVSNNEKNNKQILFAHEISFYFAFLDELQWKNKTQNHFSLYKYENNQIWIQLLSHTNEKECFFFRFLITLSFEETVCKMDIE